MDCPSQNSLATTVPLLWSKQSLALKYVPFPQETEQGYDEWVSEIDYDMNQEEEVFDTDRKKLMGKVLSEIDPRLEFVIRMRYGFNVEEDLTLEDIAIRQ